MDNLVFRKIKEKERMLFIEYAMESTRDHAGALGISFDFLKKFYKINRVLLGIPAKLLMKGMIDIVVENNQEIVAGFTILHDKREDEYQLGNYFTRPEFQGQGIGNTVLKKVITDYGDKKITLGVNSTNVVAIHLYEKYGFEKKSVIQEFIGETPLKTKPLPEEYSIRVAVKEDLTRLGRLITELPKMENLPRLFKNSFNKAQRKKLRLTNEVPAVLIKDGEIAGIGRAIWSKGRPHTASIIITAILPEASIAYPCFFSFLTEEIQQYGITHFTWELNSQTERFAKVMKPFLGVPIRIGIRMERKKNSIG
ncbi:MAG: GNAT family N-acetyltransferase [Candidatus Hermodarchaeota archaeon]